MFHRFIVPPTMLRLLKLSAPARNICKSPRPNSRRGLSLFEGPVRREGLATNRTTQVRRKNVTRLLNPVWMTHSDSVHDRGMLVAESAFPRAFAKGRRNCRLTNCGLGGNPRARNRDDNGVRRQ